MSRRPTVRRGGNGRTGTSPGKGYVSGSRPGNPPPPTTGARSAFSGCLRVALVAVAALIATVGGSVLLANWFITVAGYGAVTPVLGGVLLLVQLAVSMATTRRPA